MLQGGGTAVLAEAVRLLPKAEVLWAGLGDAQIEPTRRLAPVHSGVYQRPSRLTRSGMSGPNPQRWQHLDVLSRLS